jgi:hypothetical protein
MKNLPVFIFRINFVEIKSKKNEYGNINRPGDYKLSTSIEYKTEENGAYGSQNIYE